MEKQLKDLFEKDYKWFGVKLPDLPIESNGEYFFSVVVRVQKNREEHRLVVKFYKYRKCAKNYIENKLLLFLKKYPKYKIS